jgi:hypothetical protein
MPSYRTTDVGNRGVVLYQLSIRDPSVAFADMATYTFPLSPASVRSEPGALSTFSDTQGSPLLNGVSRVMDDYGIAPPIFTIEGTTGWDRHSTDGFVIDGLQSIMLLRNFIEQYAQMNQMQRQAGNPNLFALEFYDYFTSQFWQVQPIGPMLIRQTNDRPQLSFYRLRLAAIRPVRLNAKNVADAMLHQLNVPILQAIGSALQTTNTMLFTYGLAGITAGLG